MIVEPLEGASKKGLGVSVFVLVFWLFCVSHFYTLEGLFFASCFNIFTIFNCFICTFRYFNDEVLFISFQVIKKPIVFKLFFMYFRDYFLELEKVL